MPAEHLSRPPLFDNLMFDEKYRLLSSLLCRYDLKVCLHKLNITSVFGHYPSSCLHVKRRPVYLSRHDSETGFCLHLQVKPAQLGPIDRGFT
jgi:hypothetical protein